MRGRLPTLANSPTFTHAGAQAIVIALKSLQDHPESWHEAPVYLIGESFKAAFPCGKGRE